MADLVELLRTPSTIEAQLLQQRLRDHGIATALQGADLASQIGMSSLVVQCRVLVREDQLDEARATIAVMEATDDQVLPGPEACPACGEPWESGFTECWSCQTPLDRATGESR